MIVKSAIKQPIEVKDYPVNYSTWLSENTPTDTLVSGTTLIECITTPGNTALVVDNLVISPTGFVVWLSGGTADEVYKVSVTLTTDDGRVDQAELIISVVNF